MYFQCTQSTLWFLFTMHLTEQVLCFSCTISTLCFVFAVAWYRIIVILSPVISLELWYGCSFWNISHWSSGMGRQLYTSHLFFAGGLWGVFCGFLEGIDTSIENVDYGFFPILIPGFPSDRQQRRVLCTPVEWRRARRRRDSRMLWCPCGTVHTPRMLRQTERDRASKYER